MRLRIATVTLLIAAGFALAACGIDRAAVHPVGYGSDYDQGTGT
jgi:hypothetical protein